MFEEDTEFVRLCSKIISLPNC